MVIISELGFYKIQVKTKKKLKDFSNGEEPMSLAWYIYFDKMCFNYKTGERQYGGIDSGFACPTFRLKGRARGGK